MSNQEKAQDVIESLKNKGNRQMWDSDPIAFLKKHGFDFAGADFRSLSEYKHVLEEIDLDQPPPKPKPGNVGSSFLACAGCEIGLGATVAAVAAGIIAIIVATDGAAAAAAPEVAEGAGAAVIAAETGLTATEVAVIMCKAFLITGATGFVGVAIRLLCVATGACSDD